MQLLRLVKYETHKSRLTKNVIVGETIGRLITNVSWANVMSDVSRVYAHELYFFGYFHLTCYAS